MSSNTYLMDKRVRTVHSSIEHLHGPEKVNVAEGEIVAVCPVRDGAMYVRTFAEHHFSRGVGHIVFLDNRSEDGTRETIRELDNVTLLGSDLPFKDYKIPMRRYLVERFGQGRWLLCVDVDEMFDWPYSDVVDLPSLLRYLKNNGYTALMAQMLDMFSGEPLRTGQSGPGQEEEELRTERHGFYDLSGLRRHRYEDHNIHGAGNEVSNERIPVLSGGIRRAVFGATPTLTKHPLMFLDGRVTPMDGHLHRVCGARVADFAGVLYHYKLLDQLYEQSVRAVEEKTYFNDSASYKKYLSVLKRHPELEIKRKSSRELESVNDLVDDGFLTVSEDYLIWVDEQEQKRADRPLGYAPYRLPAALLKARARAETGADEAREREREIKHLTGKLSKQRRETKLLEDENYRLADWLVNLEEQFQALYSSRSWRLFSLVKHAGNGAPDPARASVSALAEGMGDQRRDFAGQEKEIPRQLQSVFHDGVALPPNQLRPNQKIYKEDEEYLQFARKEARWMVENLGLGTGSSLLDVGCGPGRIAIGILEGTDGIRKYRGVDVDERYIRWARHYITRGHPRFQFTHLDVKNAKYNPRGAKIDGSFALPFGEAEFDGICLFSVFTHMLTEDVRVYLKELRRLLRPGGKIVMSVWVEDGAPDVTDNPEGHLGHSYVGKPSLQRVLYNREFFESLLDESGFHLDGYDLSLRDQQKCMIVSKKSQLEGNGQVRKA